MVGLDVGARLDGVLVGDVVGAKVGDAVGPKVVQTPSAQWLSLQSASHQHSLPGTQGGQFGPPQSMSLSWLSFRPLTHSAEVGLDVGEPVGGGLGTAVGTSVGEEVGDSDGDSVGCDDGCGVGLSDVGDKDGKGVGVKVGSNVAQAPLLQDPK
jgi:hypothetical protein